MAYALLMAREGKYIQLTSPSTYHYYFPKYTLEGLICFWSSVLVRMNLQCKFMILTLQACLIYIMRHTQNSVVVLAPQDSVWV